MIRLQLRVYLHTCIFIYRGIQSSITGMFTKLMVDTLMCMIHQVCQSVSCHTHAHSHSRAHTQDLFLETANIHFTQRHGSQQKGGGAINFPLYISQMLCSRYNIKKESEKEERRKGGSEEENEIERYLERKSRQINRCWINESAL